MAEQSHFGSSGGIYDQHDSKSLASIQPLYVGNIPHFPIKINGIETRGSRINMHLNREIQLHERRTNLHLFLIGDSNKNHGLVIRNIMSNAPHIISHTKQCWHPYKLVRIII
jgi:hypothetical protein